MLGFEKGKKLKEPMIYEGGDGLNLWAVSNNIQQDKDNTLVEDSESSGEDKSEYTAFEWHVHNLQLVNRNDRKNAFIVNGEIIIGS
jgi:hypothetical protein